MTVKGMPDILNASKRTKNYKHDLNSNAHICACVRAHTHMQ